MYKLELPKEATDNRVLMHSCCAPCAGDLMERMKESGIDVTIFFITRIFIQKRNMKFVKKRIFASLKNWEFRSLTPIMMCKIGSSALKVWNGRQNVASAAPNVLTCALKELRCMPMKMALI